MKFLDKGADEMAKTKAEKSDGESGNDALISMQTEGEENTCGAVLDPPGAGKVPEITLTDYLRAGYPFIYVRTEEDQRAVQHIKRSVDAIPTMSGILYGEWRSTSGLVMGNADNVVDILGGNQEAADLVAALKFVCSRDESMVCVVHNARQFMQLAQVVQQLKDTAYQLKTMGSHVILVGASLDIPPELQNILTVYDLDLPNQAKFKEDFKLLTRTYSSSLTENPDDRLLSIAANSAVGMTQLQGENAMALSIIKSKTVDPIIVQVEKEQAIKRNDVLEFIHSREALSELGGFGSLKGWLQRRRRALTPEAIEYGLNFPKGVLLVGIPGAGKSLAARCISSYLQIPLLKLDMGKIFKSLVGSSEATVRSALKTAEAVAPVVMWVEEIEKSMAGSSSSGSTDSGTTARVMGTVLTWMQENTKPIFICATANNVDALPPELLRKGRFSEIWGVIEPNEVEREEIWNIHVNKRIKVWPDEAIDYAELAKHSAGYTGAEIEGIVEEAQFNAFYDNGRPVTTEDMTQACADIVPQSVMCKTKVDSIREWMKTKARFVSDTIDEQASRVDQGWRKIRENEN